MFERIGLSLDSGLFIFTIAEESNVEENQWSDDFKGRKDLLDHDNSVLININTKLFSLLVDCPSK